jgi:hypothetical protein
VIPAQANADFVWHMEDVLDVYRRPYDPLRPQICLDETSKQLLASVREGLPMQPGHIECEDYEYARHGVANLFLWCEPLTGRCHVEVTERRTKLDWAQVVKELVDTHYPAAERIVLVMDNLNIHTPAALYEAFPPAEAKRIADRLEIHHTPKHGSWLDMAELELSALTRQCLDRRIPDQATLIHEVAAWEQAHNAAHLGIDWQFTTDDARIRLKHLYPSIHA